MVSPILDEALPPWDYAYLATSAEIWRGDSTFAAHSAYICLAASKYFLIHCVECLDPAAIETKLACEGRWALLRASSLGGPCVVMGLDSCLEVVTGLYELYSVLEGAMLGARWSVRMYIFSPTSR